MKQANKDSCAKKHLCELMADKNSFNTVREAANDAKFICKACGRAAKAAENLCVPVKLDVRV